MHVFWNRLKPATIGSLYGIVGGTYLEHTAETTLNLIIVLKDALLVYFLGYITLIFSLYIHFQEWKRIVYAGVIYISCMLISAFDMNHMSLFFKSVENMLSTV